MKCYLPSGCVDGNGGVMIMKGQESERDTGAGIADEDGAGIW